MRKSDYYIIKSCQDQQQEGRQDHNDSSESSSSLLDLDNNMFNFTQKASNNNKNLQTDSKPASQLRPSDGEGKKLAQASSPYLTVSNNSVLRGASSIVQPENQPSGKAHSGSYLHPGGDNSYIAKKSLSNFKSRKSNGGGAGFNPQTQSSGEGAESQESVLIESVHLTCSE